jgi:hypothetical protein
MGGCNEMKPTADLEARIMNRLQTMNRGQTIEQLATYLGEPQNKILAVLMPLQRVGYVTMSKSGVWDSGSRMTPKCTSRPDCPLCQPRLQRRRLFGGRVVLVFQLGILLLD